MDRERDALSVEEESFFSCIREGRKPLANVYIGAADSRAVIYANQAMETGQKVFWPKSVSPLKEIQITNNFKRS